MPTLIASHEIGGGLRPLASRWGLKANTPIVGGAGDNMCGGVGAGVVQAGMASISLGSSGVYFLANDAFLPARGQGLRTHTPCHRGALRAEWLHPQRRRGAGLGRAARRSGGHPRTDAGGRGGRATDRRDTDLHALSRWRTHAP